MDQGRETFETLCTPCHTIGGGTLIGPDLRGVTQRRDEEWIVQFVQHSQDVIASGDSVATRLFQEYNQLIMPDQPLTEGEVRGVIAYLRQAESSAPSASSGGSGASPPAEISEEAILRGQALFQGTARFENGGPSCNSCHNVTHASVVGGGSLALDLTSAFSRLGGQRGVRAIVGNSPFPVMARAYATRPLTEDEVVAVTGFLRRADQEQGAHPPRRYAVMLLAAGLGGMAILLVAGTLIWRGRRTESIQAAIFERQTKTA